MALHVIVGAGSTGRETAILLAAGGERVRVITRSGTGPRDKRIELVAADATDADALSTFTEGAAALYNCANPPYDRWLTAWPPLAAGLLTTAERTGAVLVTLNNLYGYGPVDGPITPATPFTSTVPKFATRVTMWQDALAAHRAGRVRVTEARASDFVGPDSLSMIIMFVLPALAKRGTLRMPGRFDVPHTFTSTADVARLLVTLATDSRAWGRAWHVPSAPAATVGDVTRTLAGMAGVPVPAMRRIPSPVMTLAGLVSSDAREFQRVAYQWSRPFELDSTETGTTFGLAPTPLDESLAATLRWHRSANGW